MVSGTVYVNIHGERYQNKLGWLFGRREQLNSHFEHVRTSIVTHKGQDFARGASFFDAKSLWAKCSLQLMLVLWECAGGVLLFHQQRAWTVCCFSGETQPTCRHALRPSPCDSRCHLRLAVRGWGLRLFKTPAPIKVPVDGARNSLAFCSPPSVQNLFRELPTGKF